MEKEYTKRILVTGGLGFIGNHIVRHLVNEHKDWLILNMDCVTYAGNPANLEDIKDAENYCWLPFDIANERAVEGSMAEYKVTDVIHLAAESHVDNSITGPRPFIETNIVGTFNLLEGARKHWGNEPGHKFYYFSTDEVFGFLDKDGESFTEENKLDPSSPYSASKACGDLLVKAYWKTFKLPVVISHMCNAIGPMQYPEKLVPATIQRILNNEPIIVYDKGEQVREWIYTDDIVSAAMTVFEKGVPGEAYNIGSGNECRNIDLIMGIIDQVCAETTFNPGEFFAKKNNITIKFVENARPGHDFRYSINNNKIKTELGWEPKVSMADALTKTVDWYLANQDWVDNLKNRDKK
jgi:dTDP-glucose 4,6-dehydratase